MTAARSLALLADVAVGGPRRWAAELEDPTRVHVGAWTEERLVGVASGAIAVDDADVLVVAVDPTLRRRGIGRALTDALVLALQALGAARVLLEVRAGNEPARQLYGQLGFEEVARRRSYYRDGEDALVLARATTGPL